MQTQDFVAILCTLYVITQCMWFWTMLSYKRHLNDDHRQQYIFPVSNNENVYHKTIIHKSMKLLEAIEKPLNNEQNAKQSVMGMGNVQSNGVGHEQKQNVVQSQGPAQINVAHKQNVIDEPPEAIDIVRKIARDVLAKRKNVV